jgi:hypothetical protein
MTRLNKERNQKIKELYGKGLSFTTIGRQFGLSRQRIHQITGRSGYVYLLKCDKYYKIGSTSKPDHRIRNLKNGFPFEVEIIAVSKPIKNYQIVEVSLQKKFKKQHHKGEWFLLSETDVETFKLSLPSF